MTIKIIGLKFWRSKLNLFCLTANKNMENILLVLSGFSQGEGDPWHTSSPQMTDPWTSKRGSCVWEMVEYSDPFSVRYSTTSPIEGHPEFSLSSMASLNSFFAV